ncbi:MAG TPA: amidohydrolase family protein [Candidatus Obscuribacter sp.]|nr:amidohydrolase family protein [Candidatus Obscuribacter sp.]HND05774.1 amidohydrolase family protein [Candidatus Obscuribacter sp.]HNG17987.1 amidohydrolase family protein [Candidatus Obscuribacter sp.]
MPNYVIKCARIFTPEASDFNRIYVRDDKIVHLSRHSAVKTDAGGSPAVDVPQAYLQGFEELDFSELIAVPGFIDLQMNGTSTCNFWQDISADQLEALRLEQAQHGVTSFLPTLITDSLENLKRHRDFLASHGLGDTGNQRGLARMPGLHLEGPCLSPQKPGVHPVEHIQPLSLEVIKELVPAGSREVLLMTAALEGDPAGSVQNYLQNQQVALSLGHSNATYEEAERAFARGCRLMTHTFNALPPLHHRQPGAVGAALLDERVSCCLIADGLHLAPQICALIVKIKGLDRTILVTDRAAVGTSQGNLVGSSIILNEAVVNMIDWGICDLAGAVRMASTNAAAAIGRAQSLGQLGSGFLADIAFLDQDLKVRKTMVGGTLTPVEKSPPLTCHRQ